MSCTRKSRLAPRALVRLVLALALAGSSLVALAAPALASAPAPAKATARYEIRFLENMIDHHAMAVMMAEMCVDQAVHPELKAMCEDIVATQSTEIREMQTWLQDWYGVSHQPEMQMTGQMQRLHDLAGADFEIAFLEQMIRHHRAAIREAEGCLKKAYHPELRELCSNIIATQSAEIQQMQTWLQDWYGIRRGPRAAAA